MSRPRRRLLASLAAALALAPLPAPLAADARSTELLRYECSSDLGRRDVTLFANGTVRLRQGLWDEQELYLDELLHEELASYVAQLEGIVSPASPAPVELPSGAPAGSWVDECEIRLALPGSEPVTYAFTAYEVPPLVVAQLIHVAEDLAEFTRLPAAAERLPADYRPRRGDVLRTAAGERFRVVALSVDERGVELQGVEQPVSLFVAVDQLGEAFAALEERER